MEIFTYIGLITVFTLVLGFINYTGHLIEQEKPTTSSYVVCIVAAVLITTLIADSEEFGLAKNVSDNTVKQEGVGQNAIDK